MAGNEFFDALTSLEEERSSQALPPQATRLETVKNNLPTVGTLGSRWIAEEVETTSESFMRRHQFARATARFKHCEILVGDSPLNLEVSVYPSSHIEDALNHLGTYLADSDHAKLTGNWKEALCFSPWPCCLAIPEQDGSILHVVFVAGQDFWSFRTSFQLCLNESRKHFEALTGRSDGLFEF